MQIGDEFTAQGIRWSVYEIGQDGIVRSRAIGKKPNIQVLDYAHGCEYSERRGHDKFCSCHDYVVKGTKYCRKHQRLN